jgi:hypothetical protein
MTTYEVLDLLNSGYSVFDQIFNYWVSVSFAVVAGCYVAREHFSFPLMLTVVLLYALASFMFAVRFYSQFLLLSEASNHPGVPQAFFESAAILGPARISTFSIGFLITESFIVYSYLKWRGA